MNNYLEKLRDPRWQKKRLEVMSRDDFRCRICGDDKSTLNVHHRLYESGDPWDISDAELVTLCENCHRVETELNDLSIRALSGAFRLRFFNVDSDDIAMAMAGHVLRRPSSVNAAMIRWALQNDEICDLIDQKYFDHLDKLKH